MLIRAIPTQTYIKDWFGAEDRQESQSLRADQGNSDNRVPSKVVAVVLGLIESQSLRADQGNSHEWLPIAWVIRNRVRHKSRNPSVLIRAIPTAETAARKAEQARRVAIPPC